MTHPKSSHFTRIFFTIIFASQTDFLVSSSSLGSDNKVISTDQVVLTWLEIDSNIPRSQPEPTLTYEQRRLRDYEQNQEKMFFHTRYGEVDDEKKIKYLERTSCRIKEQEDACIRAIRLATMVEHEDLCDRVYLPQLEALAVIKAQKHNKVIDSITQEHEAKTLKERYAMYLDNFSNLPFNLRSRIISERDLQKRFADKKQPTPSASSSFASTYSFSTIATIFNLTSGLSPLSSCYQMSSLHSTLHSTSKPKAPEVNLPMTPFNIRRPKTEYQENNK